MPSRRIAPTAVTLGGAVMSFDETYRYRLWRHVSPSSKRVLFVMLNPSTADHAQDDPTLRRCRGFAGRLGCGRLDVVNLFGYRSSDPQALCDVGDPVGPSCDMYIEEALDELASDDLVIAAWGAAPIAGSWDRVQTLSAMLGHRGRSSLCLGVTKNGMPRHPLYVPANAALVRWT